MKTTNDIMNATREGLIDYALEVTAERNALKSENAELKVRLEKAVELPCKVGNTIFVASRRHKAIFECKIQRAFFEQDENGIHIHKLFCVNQFGGHNYIFRRDFNSQENGFHYAYCTREEAEAKLLELEEGR